MALKSTIVSCLVLSLLVFLEITVSEKPCDAAVDLTILLKSSANMGYSDYLLEFMFSAGLSDRVLLSQNDVRMRIMFYNNHVFQYYNDYVRYENQTPLWRQFKSTKSEESGSDVIMGLEEASKLDPVAACRRKRGARRIIVVVTDKVDNYNPQEFMAFRNLMKDRGVDVIAIAIGQHGSLAVLFGYLDLDLFRFGNGSDRIIHLENYDPLFDGSIVGNVTEEVCKVTPEMESYRDGLSVAFRAKYKYKGHTYYLSREEANNLIQMHDTCSSAGGYLAVMNDQQEYDAMKQYFIDNDHGYGFYIDGTDAQAEGNWTLFSGAPLPFVDWLDASRPDRQDLDCLAWSPRSQKMFAEWCDGENHPNYRYLFLCEVSDRCET